MILQIVLLLHLLLHLRMSLRATSIIYNEVFPIISIVYCIYEIVRLIPCTWQDSSTVNTTAVESCQRRKKRLSRLLNNRVSECWRIVPTNVEESCKRIQKHKMDVWYNVNIASTLDLQITYYVQYQFHKVLPLVLTKARRGAPEALLIQPPLLQLFNMLQIPLQKR